MAEQNPGSKDLAATPSSNAAQDHSQGNISSLEKGSEHVDHNAGAFSTTETAKVTRNKDRQESPDRTSEPASDHAISAESAKPAAPAPEDTRSKGKTVLIMAALMMATFLAALDMTIVTTALPTIAGDFQVSNADYTWVGSAYLLGAAASTPTWGKISDTFGRKPTILVANVIFLIGSLICALSINIHMLLGGRVIQGIGGGGLIILSNICITDLFSMRLVHLIVRYKANNIQISRYVLWLDRHGMGICFCYWSRLGWCVYRICYMAMVFLHQL